MIKLFGKFVNDCFCTYYFLRGRHDHSDRSMTDLANEKQNRYIAMSTDAIEKESRQESQRDTNVVLRSDENGNITSDARVKSKGKDRQQLEPLPEHRNKLINITERAWDDEVDEIEKELDTVWVNGQSTLENQREYHGLIVNRFRLSYTEQFHRGRHTGRSQLIWDRCDWKRFESGRHY